LLAKKKRLPSSRSTRVNLIYDDKERVKVNILAPRGGGLIANLIRASWEKKVTFTKKRREEDRVSGERKKKKRESPWLSTVIKERGLKGKAEEGKKKNFPLGEKTKEVQTRMAKRREERQPLSVRKKRITR